MNKNYYIPQNRMPDALINSDFLYNPVQLLPFLEIFGYDKEKGWEWNGIEKLFELNNNELRLVLSEAYQLWYEDKWLGFRGYSGFHSLRCPLCGGRLFAGISELENNKGKQFDPDIVDHTLKLIKQGVIKIR